MPVRPGLSAASRNNRIDRGRQAADDSRLAACAPQNDCFGETPKSARKTRALPVICLALAFFDDDKFW